MPINFSAEYSYNYFLYGFIPVLRDKAYYGLNVNSDLT